MKKVFVNGTFDLIHSGHIHLLNYAKILGDFLYVAIDTDERVKEKKGESRPIYNLKERIFHLQNLNSVDVVLSFATDEQLENLVKIVKPDIMLVGSDWKGGTIIGSQHTKTLKFFDRIEEYATTKTIQSIIDRRQL